MEGGLGPGIPGKTWKKWNCSVLELGKERSPSPQQRVPHPGIPWEYPQGMALQEFPELSTFSRKKFPLNSNLDTALCYSLGKVPQLLPGSTLFRGWIIGISAFFGINPSVRLGMMDEESAFQDSQRSAAGSLGCFCFRALFLGKKNSRCGFSREWLLFLRGRGFYSDLKKKKKRFSLSLARRRRGSHFGAALRGTEPLPVPARGFPAGGKL